MTDQPTTRDQLIEQAAQVLASLGADHLTADDYMTDVRALADAGLLADPEHALDLENAKGTLAAVRWKLGTPKGRAVSMHAGEVAAELKTLRAKVDDLAAERDLALWLHAEAEWRVAGFDAITVKLAQINQQITAERDALQARLDAALAFHVEYSIYADCGHADHDDDEDIVDLGDKYVCAEGYQYSVCLACCCDGDTNGQHEVCAEQHCPDEKPNLCWPCPTRRALKDLAEPTGEVNRG